MNSVQRFDFHLSDCSGYFLSISAPYWFPALIARSMAASVSTLKFRRTTSLKISSNSFAVAFRAPLFILTPIRSFMRRLIYEGATFRPKTDAPLDASIVIMLMRCSPSPKQFGSSFTRLGMGPAFAQEGG